MPKLDAKHIELSDGTEITVRLTWAAAKRFRDATGVDLADMPGLDPAERKKLGQELPQFIYCAMVKSDREKYTPDDIAESVDLLDAPRLIRLIFDDATEAGKEKGQEQQNVPFVNGLAEVSNSPTQ